MLPTVKPKYKWTTVDSNYPKVKSEYGEFIQQGDEFIFVGSYMTDKWRTYWYNKSFHNTDFNELLKEVENLIGDYELHCRLVFANKNIWRAVIISLICVVFYAYQLNML